MPSVEINDIGNTVYCTPTTVHALQIISGLILSKAVIMERNQNDKTGRSAPQIAKAQFGQGLHYTLCTSQATP